VKIETFVGEAGVQVDSTIVAKVARLLFRAPFPLAALALISAAFQSEPAPPC
jgi:hypothetical protein